MAVVGMQPTNFYWPPQYPGGQPQQVYLCSMGCLVLQTAISVHQTQAHP